MSHGFFLNLCFSYKVASGCALMLMIVIVSATTLLPPLHAASHDSQCAAYIEIHKDKHSYAHAHRLKKVTFTRLSAKSPAVTDNCTKAQFTLGATTTKPYVNKCEHGENCKAGVKTLQVTLTIHEPDLI